MRCLYRFHGTRCHIFHILPNIPLHLSRHKVLGKCHSSTHHLVLLQLWQELRSFIGVAPNFSISSGFKKWPAQNPEHFSQWSCLCLMSHTFLKSAYNSGFSRWSFSFILLPFSPSSVVDLMSQHLCISESLSHHKDNHSHGQCIHLLLTQVIRCSLKYGRVSIYIVRMCCQYILSNHCWSSMLAMCC